MDFQLILLMATDPNAGHGVGELLNNIGLCVIVAAALAFVANKLKQPALLAYLLAGVLIGPEIGFRLITDHEIIEVISEIGLVLLLFIIGLEMDLKKLRASGKPVIATGVTQFSDLRGARNSVLPAAGISPWRPECVGRRVWTFLHVGGRRHQQHDDCGQVALRQV